MYHHSSVTFSPKLRRAIADGQSRPTAFGIRAAVQFGQAVMMSPHIIGSATEGVNISSFELVSVLADLANGWLVKDMIERAKRVTMYIDLVTRPSYHDWEIRVAIAGHGAADRRAGSRLEVCFDHYHGHVTLAAWHHGKQRAKQGAVFTCQDCLAHSLTPETFEHRLGCPRHPQSGMNDQIEFDRGYEDAYHNRNQSGGMPAYNLGYDMGGLCYQADIACGRRTPSM